MKICFKQILETQKKIKNKIRWTETSFSEQVSEKTGSKIFIKYENRQHTGA